MAPLELLPFGPDDAEHLTTYTELNERVRRADSPWEHESTRTSVEHRLRWGWDLHPDRAFLVIADGVPVGAASHSVNVYDNLDLTWLDLAIDPAHRRQGHGTAALDLLLDHVRGLGMSSYGIACWDLPGPAAFADRFGLEVRSVSACRRQDLADVDWAALDDLYARAEGAAADYEIIRREGLTPDEALDETAVMVAAINDAPRDGLEMEDEAFPAERVRAFEEAQTRRGTLRRVIARHRETGELAGQTVVVVEHERPEIGHQEDTSVVASHRGHRLGMLLKIDMLRWLCDTHPDLATIDTWNAVSNDFMIGVNEAMGYRLIHTALHYQDEL